MLLGRLNPARIFVFACIFMFSTLMALSPAYAGPLKPVPGKFTAVMQGVDPDTGELIFEGPKDGPIPGHLAIRASIIRQTGMAMHLAANWTLTTPWGEIIKGENALVLNTKSLHFREHGVVVDATGSLTERIGSFIVVQGEISDLDFVPGATTVTGNATIVPSQAKRYQ